MTREVRAVMWILAVVLVVVVILDRAGVDPLPFVPLPVLVVMSWGVIDAAAHRDSVWRAADQNKLVWVLVQLIPVVGTMAFYILVHRTLLDAEDRVPTRR